MSCVCNMCQDDIHCFSQFLRIIKTWLQDYVEKTRKEGLSKYQERNKSTQCELLLVLTELIASGTQWTGWTVPDQGLLWWSINPWGSNPKFLFKFFWKSYKNKENSIWLNFHFRLFLYLNTWYLVLQCTATHKVLPCGGVRMGTQVMGTIWHSMGLPRTGCSYQ